MEEKASESLVAHFKNVLGERVNDVRMTVRLSDSPARLVDPEGALDQSMQRVYQMMDKQFELPKKVLELNPKHPIIAGLAHLPENDPRFDLIAEQVYEGRLAGGRTASRTRSVWSSRIQDLITEVLEKKDTN